MGTKDAATGHSDETETKIMKHPEVKKRNTAIDVNQPTIVLDKNHLESRYDNGSSLEVIHDTIKKDLIVNNLNKQSDSGFYS